MLKLVRNFCYGAAVLTWTVAGLDGALKEDLLPAFFSYAGKTGFLFLALALIVELVRRFVERDAVTKLYEPNRVKRGELSEVRELSRKFIPDVPDLEQLQLIFEASRKCIWFVESTRRSAGGKKIERVGFFSIIRLTEEAVRLFSKNALDGFRLNRTHIAGPRSKAPALYIGGLGAKGFRAKGWLVQHVRTRLDEFFEDGGKIVFTRPVTDDGMKAAIRLGFVPVISNRSALGDIYKLESPLQ